MTDLIVRSCAAAIEKHPLINSQLQGHEIRMIRDINIGVAVDAEKGLVVPVIHGANRKGVIQINKELREKADKARTGTLAQEDMQNSTFTITNLGMLGIEQFIPIINPPECAIVAIGSIVKEPIVDKSTEQVRVAPLFWMSLAFDHRIIDGAPAGRFLADLKQIMEWPYAIID